MFRETFDRPAIVVQASGSVAIRACVFFNNTYTGSPSPNLNVTTSYGGAGSAVLVQPRGSITEISSTVFKWNGYGSGTTAGGAIALSGPGACLSYVFNSAFISNGRADAGFRYGGAIGGVTMDGCDIRVGAGCTAGTWRNRGSQRNVDARMLCRGSK